MEENRDSTVAQLPAKLGVVTTWNQPCGLATYARFLFSHPLFKDATIFSERTKESVVNAEEQNVIRCWMRREENYEELEAQVIRAGIELLHVNAHDHTFFRQPDFTDMLQRLRKRGIRLISSFHTTYTRDPVMTRYLDALDHVLVHTADNRLQIIANGAEPGKVSVIPHGIYSRGYQTEERKRQARGELALPISGPAILVSFGFVQPNKGIEGLIETVAHLRSKGREAKGYIVGKINREHPAGESYYQQLMRHAQALGVQDEIHFTDRFVSEDEVHEYMMAADIVVFNYQSNYYESSGACSLAVGAGVPVIASLAPAFLAFGDAVWRVTGGFPLALSAELLLSSAALRDTLTRQARAYTEDNAWGPTAERFCSVYNKLFGPVRESKEAVELTEARDAFEAENFEHAVTLLQKVVEGSAATPRVWAALALAAAQCRNWRLAFSAGLCALTSGSDISPVASILREASHQRQIDLQELENCLAEANAIVPGNLELTVGLTTVLLRKGQVQEARKALSAVEKLSEMGCDGSGYLALKRKLERLSRGFEVPSAQFSSAGS